ncbi:MAG TPA: hypothetical protein VGS41_12430 [Chthonomonadales bacterium]|nr:hypothetical protein [Chthonomonadales bacterium]
MRASPLFRWFFRVMPALGMLASAALVGQQYLRIATLRADTIQTMGELKMTEMRYNQLVRLQRSRISRADSGRAKSAGARSTPRG